MKRQQLSPAYHLLPTIVVLLGFALSGPMAPFPARASQPPTPTPTHPYQDVAADALAWAALPWACGLQALAVLLGLYLVLARPAPVAVEDSAIPQGRSGE